MTIREVEGGGEEDGGGVINREKSRECESEPTETARRCQLVAGYLTCSRLSRGAEAGAADSAEHQTSQIDPGSAQPKAFRSRRR